MGAHHQSRYEDGVKLGELPIFQNAPNKKRQRIIARQMFRNMTEQEIDEIVEIARMGISFEDLQVALTGKPVQRQVSAEGNEDDSDDDIDIASEGDCNRLLSSDESSLQQDAGGQESVSGVDIKEHTLEAEVDAGCEGMKDRIIDAYEGQAEKQVSDDDEGGDEYVDGIDEEAEERGVDFELVEQERLEAGAEVQADAEDELVDSWEEQEDVNPSSDYEELEYLEMREEETEREIRRWSSMSKLNELKADLGSYNPNPRRLRVKVVADEPVIEPDNLPEAKA
jgi:hypothetical protein